MLEFDEAVRSADARGAAVAAEADSVFAGPSVDVLVAMALFFTALVAEPTTLARLASRVESDGAGLSLFFASW